MQVTAGSRRQATEMFFEEAAKISDFAADEELYRVCEMEIVGPPLSLG